jgi:hypothetical protein
VSPSKQAAITVIIKMLPDSAVFLARRTGCSWYGKARAGKPLKRLTELTGPSTTPLKRLCENILNFRISADSLCGLGRAFHFFSALSDLNVHFSSSFCFMLYMRRGSSPFSVH